MNQSKIMILLIAIFVTLSLAPFPKAHAQIVRPELFPSQPIYALWGVGGKPTLTAGLLNVNLTYYVWLQRPGDKSTSLIGVTLAARSSTRTFQVPVAVTDPPGTYLVSLSTSTSTDTREAAAHFGVVGVDRSRYSRTDTVQIAGGGYAPNSTIIVMLRSPSQAIGNLSLKVDPRGEFKASYKLLFSSPTGLLTVSMSGPSFDTNALSGATASALVGVALLTFTQQTQPPSTLERTSTLTLSWKVSYPDGSPVTSSTQNSTRLSMVDETTGSSTELRLQLSDPAAGVWSTTWSPSFSASLGTFHFVMYPTDFDDIYGNTGRGTAFISTSIKLTAAHTRLVVQGNSTLERTLSATFVLIPTYHDGTPFQNITQSSGTFTDPNGTIRQLSFSGAVTGLVGVYATNSSTPLGTLRLAATVADIFGNVATGQIASQIVPAVLAFHVPTPTAQRTQMLNVTTRVTYPDGSLITQDNLPLGFNVTVQAANFTWTHQMLYDPITKDWSAGFVLSQNATVGNYLVGMSARDPYSNFGAYSGIAKVFPATFTIELPLASEKVYPNTLVYIDARVSYPNRSALTPTVGGAVEASLTNSSGTFTYPMVFNATDKSWLFVYTAPDPGYRFGLTIPFSFSAMDKFGNAGSASHAFEVDVGAGVESLVLATVFGAIVPIGLVGWAIATIAGRRRKHKP